jgi:hypothetical protein
VTPVSRATSVQAARIAGRESISVRSRSKPTGRTGPGPAGSRSGAGVPVTGKSGPAAGHRSDGWLYVTKFFGPSP